MSYCPYCGTQNADANKFCQNCGSPLPNVEAAQDTNYGANGYQNPGFGNAVTSPANTIDQLGYNLYVDFMSVHPGVNMDIYFQDWPEKHVLYNNEQKVFMLNPGIHTAIIRIGNKAYKRNITIGPGYTRPVTIHCAWDGRARINMA